MSMNVCCKNIDVMGIVTSDAIFCLLTLRNPFFLLVRHQNLCGRSCYHTQQASIESKRTGNLKQMILKDNLISTLREARLKYFPFFKCYIICVLPGHDVYKRHSQLSPVDATSAQVAPRTGRFLLFVVTAFDGGLHRRENFHCESVT